ncbi:hypothetical protein M3C61_10850, partial [Dermacoccus abyssi]|uniref:hypothetical protein n=1 Tax=Dermacoccus abyssi TaxID=322596 RepID=UPI0021A2CC99|nr:hypothetical protein [Dermacoccus abyssi]
MPEAFGAAAEVEAAFFDAGLEAERDPDDDDDDVFADGPLVVDELDALDEVDAATGSDDESSLPPQPERPTAQTRASEARNFPREFFMAIILRV